MEEEAQAQLDIQLAQETTYANKAKDLSTEVGYCLLMFCFSEQIINLMPHRSTSHISFYQLPIISALWGRYAVEESQRNGDSKVQVCVNSSYLVRNIAFQSGSSNACFIIISSFFLWSSSHDVFEAYFAFCIPYRCWRHCRKLTTQEKKMLGVTLGKLSLENLYRALDVVAETNPIFQPSGDEVDLDLDAQVNTVIPC